jgi:hypothetical protein
MKYPTTKRGADWRSFASEVLNHIESYTINQYGDKENDIASSYNAEDCIKHIQRYVTRFGKNARPGQDRLDLLKIAHYAQMAATILDSNGSESLEWTEDTSVPIFYKEEALIKIKGAAENFSNIDDYALCGVFHDYRGQDAKMQKIMEEYYQYIEAPVVWRLAPKDREYMIERVKEYLASL